MKSTGKIALVTGGSRGLGKNMALRLAEKGIGVVLTYLNSKDEADKVVAEIKAAGVTAAAVRLDTADPKSFNAFSAEFSGVLNDQFKAERFDFLVNNAGVAGNTLLGQTEFEQVDELINIHFKGVYFLTQQLLGLLNDGGRIVNISSGLARFSFPGSSVYGALKSAVETLTRYWAKELGGRGIAVNVVAPGAIETDFNSGRVRDNAELNKNIAGMTALGRVGLPDDIGGVVAFLCSEEARWINAQRIEVSGGMML
jgi:NAD(P)-dependent dehydrogenase (short-subunit alcohol dehydrogenase family)